MERTSTNPNGRVSTPFWLVHCKCDGARCAKLDISLSSMKLSMMEVDGEVAGKELLNG